MAFTESEREVPHEDGDSSSPDARITENINGEEEDSLVSSMRERLGVLSERPSTDDGATIFRVPAGLRKDRKDFIEPSVVSIGPYHRGRKRLAPMEDKKWLLLQDTLSRPGHNEVTLEACVENIKCLQLQARSCYSERVDMDDKSFVEMLILDGTFIIQFLSRSVDWFERETGWATPCIRTDLMLLENQIPLFVVHSLCGLYFGSPVLVANRENLEALLVPGFRSRNIALPENEFQPGNIAIPENTFHHLLHLCHHYTVPNMSRHDSVLPKRCSCFKICSCANSNYEYPHELTIPCAVELEEAGVKFKKKMSPCKMDITFRAGTLEIPSMTLDCTMKPLFINLGAFEQNRRQFLRQDLTSYASFMDCIINTKHDVTILQRHGILRSMLPGEEEVAVFFNQLCDGAVVHPNHYLSELFMEVNRYCDSKYHRYRAKLMRDYFNSPWSIISLIGAVLILGLTFAQTYFASHDYFHPSQK